MPLVVAALVLGVVGVGARAGGAAKAPPPIPSCFRTGSGYGLCEGMVIPGGAAVVKMTLANQKTWFELTGPAPLQSKKAVACGDAGCVYNHLDWVVGPGAAVVSGCKTNTSTCDVKVPPGSTRWTVVYVRQNNDPATLWAIWNSGKTGAATISGYVRDREAQGVSGVTIDAYGTGGGSRGQRGSAVSGGAGFYTMEVAAGSYKVIPSGFLIGKKQPRYEPASRGLTLEAGDRASAGFTLQGGLQVTLTLSSGKVLADGSTVVAGDVATTQYGKPMPNVTVSLRPKPDATPTNAVTRGARATICAPNGLRIWPTGTLATPVGSPVDITTDGTGHYKLTMTVGTVPGTFPLSVWARDKAGKLITTDLADTSDEGSLTIASPGNLKVGQFISELALLKGDHAASALLASMTNDAANITQTLSELSRGNAMLGGLAYSLVNGAGGTAVLIHDGTRPPGVSATGKVIAAPGNARARAQPMGRHQLGPDPLRRHGSQRRHPTRPAQCRADVRAVDRRRCRPRLEADGQRSLGLQPELRIRRLAVPGRGEGRLQLAATRQAHPIVVARVTPRPA